jgi:hypothetical protein
MGDQRVVPINLPAEQTAILRSDLLGGAAGALEDLRRPERLADPAALAREGAIFVRLLDALDQGEIGLPDEEARARIEALGENFDDTSGYPEITATHDAHRALLDVLGGPSSDRGCTR